MGVHAKAARRFGRTGPSGTLCAASGIYVQPRCVATSRKAATLPTILDQVHRVPSENSVIRIVQVTTGTPRLHHSGRGSGRR